MALHDFYNNGRILRIHLFSMLSWALGLFVIGYAWAHFYIFHQNEFVRQHTPKDLMRVIVFSSIAGTISTTISSLFWLIPFLPHLCKARRNHHVRADSSSYARVFVLAACLSAAVFAFHLASVVVQATYFPSTRKRCANLFLLPDDERRAFEFAAPYVPRTGCGYGNDCEDATAESVCAGFYTLRDFTIAAMTFSLLTVVGSIEWERLGRGLRSEASNPVIGHEGEGSLGMSDSNASEVGFSAGSGKEKIDV